MDNKAIEQSRELLGQNTVDMLLQSHQDALWILENLGVKCIQPDIQKAFSQFSDTGEALIYEDRIYITSTLVEQ